MLSLTNKVALVTGGTRGIGKGIVKQLCSMGAKVAFTYSNSTEKANELVAELKDQGHEASAHKADVVNFKQAQEVVAEVSKQWGGLDILVNNAGLTKDNLILRMSEEQWHSVIDINLNGTFNYCKAASRTMLRSKAGSIINISSVVGIHGNPGQSNYSAAKSALFGFSKSLAKELASRNVRVNVIAPGYVYTELTGTLSEELVEKIKSQTPLNRPGEIEEIAQTVGFLASDWSSYITGEVIRVDGGMAM